MLTYQNRYLHLHKANLVCMYNVKKEHREEQRQRVRKKKKSTQLEFSVWCNAIELLLLLYKIE
jgi:hypothetical protein